MKTTSTRKKTASVDVDQATRIAFQQLCDQTATEQKAERDAQRAERYKQWQGAARRFKGLSEALALRIEMRNIHASKEGYVVNFMRNREEFKRHFFGLNDKSLAAAVEFRDKAAKLFGSTNNSIPASVLKALKLSVPVPGITRGGSPPTYTLSGDAPGRTGRPARYPVDVLSEEDAYAAAIECLEASLKAK